MKKMILFIGIVCFAFSMNGYGQIEVNAGKASLGRMQLSQLDESLRNYSIFSLGEVDRLFPGKGEAKILMNLGNEFQWDLELEDNNSLISGDYKATLITENGEIELPKPDVKLFKSKDPDNTTRIAVYDGMISGVIEKDGERYAITPLSTFMTDNSKRLVVYNEKDIKKEAKVYLSGPIEEALDKQIETRAVADFTNTVRIIKVDARADYAFYAKYGKSASRVQTKMIDDINKCEAIYSRDLNIRFSVSHMDMFSDPNKDRNEFGYYEIPVEPNETSEDRFEKHFERGKNYLANIKKYGNANQTDRDIMIVFTANNFGFIGGMAYKGMKCATLGQHYAFIYDSNNAYIKAAHEMGHIFGASDITDNSLMHDGSSTRFSAYSLNEIRSHLSGINCITMTTIPQITRIEGTAYASKMPTRYSASPSPYNLATCEWSISPYAPIQSLNGYNTDVIIDFSSVSGSSYSLSCIPVATVTMSGKAHRIQGKGAYLSVSISSSYRIYNDRESITITYDVNENAGEFIFAKTSATVIYSLSNALTGILADKGTVNIDNGTINVSCLPKGIYILTLTTANGNTESHKLSIQ